MRTDHPSGELGGQRGFAFAALAAHDAVAFTAQQPLKREQFATAANETGLRLVGEIAQARRERGLQVLLRLPLRHGTEELRVIPLLKEHGYEPVFEPQFAHLFSAQDSQLYRQAVERIQAAHDRLYADPSGIRVIHYDLHHWNVKLHRGRIYALDFEDLMWGYPVQDIAITLYYWQAHSQRAALFDAFRRGYTSQAEWPESYPGEIDAFMAGRGIMLVNYLLCSQEIEDQEMTPAFIERVAERLRAFLDTDESVV